MAAPARPALRMLKVKEMADVCMVSPKTVRRLIESGELPHYRMGRCVRVAEDDARRFIAARRQ